MHIKGRKISNNQPPYIVAEVGANHCGKLDEALRLIEAAKRVGADAVKFQCYLPEEITLKSDKPDFVIKDGPWKGRTLYDLYEAAYTPREWFRWLFEQGKRCGITVFSSVFSPQGVEFLEGFDCPAYKIASMEVTDTELIKCAALTGKPVIVSTGMAQWREIKAAFDTIREVRDTPEGEYIKDTIWLHCVSGYPTPIEEAALGALRPIMDFGGRYGISDHTTGIEIPIAATALGACLIEKHFTLDPSNGSEDAAFSLRQYKFQDMVEAVHATWKATQPSERKSEEPSRQLRRSLYVVRDMKQGEKFTYLNVRSIRPSYGLPPSEILKIIGKSAKRDIERGTALAWEMVDAGTGESKTRDLLPESLQGDEGS